MHFLSQEFGIKRTTPTQNTVFNYKEYKNFCPQTEHKNFPTRRKRLYDYDLNVPIAYPFPTSE